MTWQDFINEVKVLSAQINYSPDIIIGIVRGGIIPARLLSNNLKVKEIYCITVKKIGKERKVMSDVLEELKGKNILLVEDMLETGKSLIIAKEYLEKKGAAVKTACLYAMPNSEIKPDYYLKEIKEVIKFPWE